jgi:tetratricopeptide (TPR) repeat protein
MNNANIALIKKDASGALAEIEKALVLKPNYLDAFFLKGQIEQSQGDSQAVKNELVKYISLAPYDDQGYVLLSNAYISLKDYPSALDALSRARSLNPNNANTYLAYIGTLELSGNKSKAIEELQTFKKQFPNVTGVDEQISRIQNGTN